MFGSPGSPRSPERHSITRPESDQFADLQRSLRLISAELKELRQDLVKNRGIIKAAEDQEDSIFDAIKRLKGDSWQELPPEQIRTIDIKPSWDVDITGVGVKPEAPVPFAKHKAPISREVVIQEVGAEEVDNDSEYVFKTAVQLEHSTVSDLVYSRSSGAVIRVSHDGDPGKNFTIPIERGDDVDAILKDPHAFREQSKVTSENNA